MGVTPFGMPAIGIGINRDVGWGVTVSTSTRFSLYELQLNPENPLQYVHDGEMRDLSPVQVSAERQTEDGGVETVERTFHESQFGPVIGLGAVSPPLGGWPDAVGTLLVYRDAGVAGWKERKPAITTAQCASVNRFTNPAQPGKSASVSTTSAALLPP